jgi:16S rRNA (guanine527-N7)-methyltransferase
MDSLRALPCFRPADRTLMDVGSGAGLPGIPLALASPDRQFLLLEPHRRRAGFLELAVDELRLENTKVLVSRVEDVDIRVDACVVRAFAPPLEAWHRCARLLNPRGHLLYYAGRSWNLDIQARLRQAGLTPSVCSPPEHGGGGQVVSISRADPIAGR